MGAATSFMLGWACHLEGGCSSGRLFVAAVQVYRPLAGSGWSYKTARRVGCSSLGFGLFGRHTRQGAEIDNLSAVRIAAEKIDAGLPPD
jgi:hypothetical protein